MLENGIALRQIKYAAQVFAAGPSQARTVCSVSMTAVAVISLPIALPSLLAQALSQDMTQRAIEYAQAILGISNLTLECYLISKATHLFSSAFIESTPS